MFGVTTPCVQQIAGLLKDDYECLVFHATGVGGQSMEKLIDSGLLAGVIDITTTEVCDLLMGGVMPATEDRFGSVIRARMPYVGSCGALDMVNFGAAGHRARPLPGPHPLPAQSAGHLDAHHGRGERPDRPLDRRAPQPDGRAGALLPAGRRRLRARRAGRPRSTTRRRMPRCSRRSSARCARPRCASSSACRSTSTIRSSPPRSCRRSAPCMAPAASGAGAAR